MLAGFASERLILLDAQDSTPAVSMLMGWNALTEPAATRLIVPMGDGDKVKLPCTLMSPEKEVTFRLGGSNSMTLAKGVRFVSTNPSQGAEELNSAPPPEESCWL